MRPDVSRETVSKLQELMALVIDEQQRQNLIASSTIPTFFDRHIEDSRQLLDHIDDTQTLVDIGSGGGFPGLVLALCRTGMTHLVEPRAKRAAFLERAVRALGLQDRAVVHASKIQTLEIPMVGTITARAVAPLDDLFNWSSHLATDSTRWVLPKGRSAASELDRIAQSWQGRFRLVPSLTDSEAAIVIAEEVRRRKVL